MFYMYSLFWPFFEAVISLEITFYLVSDLGQSKSGMSTLYIEESKS